jgi:energy-coupling factor transporter ATP-binding protein EcfA2
MAEYIRQIIGRGIYGRFDFQLDFEPGINVVYGMNGTGKTTLLSILANALNGDFDRFAFFVPFRSVLIQLDDDTPIRITCREELDDLRSTVEPFVAVEISGKLVDRFSVRMIESLEPTLSQPAGNPTTVWPHDQTPRPPVMPVTYFPSFRTVVEAWKTVLAKKVDMQSSPSQANDGATDFVRRWLLPFVPRINYPSLVEVEQYLGNQRQTQAKKGGINEYLHVLNGLLQGKRLITNRQESSTGRPPVDVIFDDGTRTRGLSALTSGERQMTTLLFSAICQKSSKIILIDEPETSLHVSWQRQLLKQMVTRDPVQQIIACTHSPVIAADYPMSELKVTATTPDEDEEIPF